MISKFERFWIAFILRFAYGFLFLFAALNIFTYGIENFSNELAKGFEPTWLGQIYITEGLTGMVVVRMFLKGAPFVMAGLSVAILTGIFWKTALRIAVLVLLCFGLGKYIQNDIPTTAADFLFAFIICVGLFVLGQAKRADAEC